MSGLIILSCWRIPHKTHTFAFQNKLLLLKARTVIKAEGLEIPVDIFHELRRDTRFGLTGRRATLRVPHGAPPEFVREQIMRLEIWVAQVLRDKPAMRQPFTRKNYQTGDTLVVGGRKYLLDLKTEERSSHTARLIGDTIHIQLASHASEMHQHKSIKTLLSRVVAGDFYPEIHQRVHEWNSRTVRRPIKSVNLKYNHSNWGSCSSNSNVNLSTRLLFAPVPVQDYVIVHELAHLVEMNHSDKFWALVAHYMPDYVEKERWLKANRALCDF